MQIIKHGTRVITVLGSIKAFITGASIRGENNTYEISYFHNGERVSTWVYRFEFEVDMSERKQAGFKTYDEKVLLLE